MCTPYMKDLKTGAKKVMSTIKELKEKGGR